MSIMPKKFFNSAEKSHAKYYLNLALTCKNKKEALPTEEKVNVELAVTRAKNWKLGIFLWYKAYLVSRYFKI